MFDLEKSIANWRCQMLAAGIKAPVPSEELEGHLREEIEQQMKLGANKQKAFEMAVQQIGQPKILDSEFKKKRKDVYETNDKSRRRNHRHISWIGAYHASGRSSST